MEMEIVEETITRQKNRKQPNAPNWSSTQRENSAPGGKHQQAPKQKRVLVQ